MLQVRNLTKSYRTHVGRHYVFRDISIDFPEDANIGILGPNGAGKSTLLRILGGIDFPDTGTIYCDRSMSWPLGLRGGFVANLSGRENCKIICSLYGLDPATIRVKLDFIKELSGIGSYFEEPVKYYSSGMGSRIGFALSMAFDFEILLIDEITSVGDRNFRDIAKQAIDEKRGTSNVIMVSHSMGSIRDFCDVGILLRDGKMTVYDDLDQAIRAYLPKENKKASSQVDELIVTTEVDDDIFSEDTDKEVENMRLQIAGRFRQIEQAIQDSDEILDPGKFHHLLGVCYSRLGDHQRAYHNHQLAVAEAPDKPGFHVQMIASTMNLGLLDQAEDALRDALKWWDNNAALFNQYASLRTRQGRWHDSLELHAKAIELAPNNAGLRMTYANSLIMTNNYDEAVIQCKRAIALDSHSPHAYKTLSRALAGLSRYDGSIRALREFELKQQQIGGDHPAGSRSQLKILWSTLEKVADLIG